MAGAICFYAVALKNRLGWDDALDVWGVHGVGGLIGVSLFRVMELLLKDQTKKAVTVLAPVGGIFSFLILFLVNR